MAWRAFRRLLGSAAPAATVPAPSDSLPPGVYRMKGVIFDPTPARLPIAGESFRQETLQALGGRRGERGVERPSQMAALMPEPTNPKDREAVAVLIAGQLVGYLRRQDARVYRPVLDLIAVRGLGVGCHATLTGGWDRGPDDRGAIGVVLHLGSPAQLMAELRAGGFLPGAPVEDAPPAPTPPPPDLGDLTGKTVCFTGESVCTVAGRPVSRTTQEILATNAGLRVLARVTKKLDLLVVSPLADPNHAKLTTARRYGTPQIDEAAFWRALGVKID